jgi:hypothetical protein
VRKKETKLTYGPRGVVDVSWAVFLVCFIVRRHRRLLHQFFMCRYCHIAVAVTLLSLLLVLPSLVRVTIVTK